MPTGTALTDNADFQAFSEFQEIPFVPVASTAVYKGGFAMIVTASGLVQPVPVNNSTDCTLCRVVGQFAQQPRNGTATTEASSPAPLAVRTEGIFECNALAAASWTQADCGSVAYATSDNEIVKTANTYNPKAGIFMGFSPVTGRALIKMSIQTPA